MKIWTSEHTFKHSWDTVAQAAWRKYPNPMNPSVIGIDVVDRKVEKGILKSHRLIATEWGFPPWVVKLVGFDDQCYVSEHSEVDSKQKVMKLRSRNLTFCNFVTIDEQIEYKPDPRDPKNSTLLTQEAVINVKGVPMTDYMEGIIKGTISNKAQLGRNAMEWVIAKVKDEAQDISRAAQKEMTNLQKEMSNLKIGAHTRSSTSL